MFARKLVGLLFSFVACGVGFTAHAAPLAYVANDNTTTVTVIDTATNTVLGAIPAGTSPWGLAVRPGGAEVYVANFVSNNVTIIATATNSVVATVPVGVQPKGVAFKPDGTRAYVANSGDNTVSVIDTASRVVIASVGVGAHPIGIAVNPAGTEAYVANQVSNTVTVINTATYATSTITGLGVPYGVAFSPDGARAYVTNRYFAFNYVAVIDTATGLRVDTIYVGTTPWGIALNPAGTRAYVANRNSADVSVIDLTAVPPTVTSVTVGSEPVDVAVNPAGTLVYATNYGSSTVSVIDTATNAVVATVSGLAGPVGIGFANAAASSVPPSFYAVRPNSASIAGGSAIVIDGANLGSVNSVTFGGTPAAILSATATALTVVAPSHSVGTVDLVIANAGSSTTAASAFNYVNDDSVARDYSITANPSPRWSYGWEPRSLTPAGAPTPGGPFTLYTTSYPGAFDQWSSGSLPTVLHNPTTATLAIATNTTTPGGFGLHPGVNLEYSVARWTAPSSGLYRVAGYFMGSDIAPTSTDVWVLHNNNAVTPLFSGAIASYNVPLNFSVDVTVAAGDTIEFAVGPGPNDYCCDQTQLEAKVSPVAVSPAPLSCTIFTTVPSMGDAASFAAMVIAPPGSTVYLSVGCSDNTNAIYLWDTSETAGSITVTAPPVAATMVHSVTVTTPSGVGSATVTLAGAIPGTPICTLTPSVNIPVPVAFAATFTMTAVCSPAATSFTWSNYSNVPVVSGQGTSVATYQLVAPSAGYGYTVFVTPANATGQGPDASKLIWVNPLTVSPASLAFSATGVGTLSAAQSVTFSNVSDYWDGSPAFTTTGPFVITGSCPSPFLHATTCTIDVQFAPTVTGSGQTGSVSLFTGFPGNSTLTVSLAGDGVAIATPAITFTPTSLTFPARSIGSTSSGQTITVAASNANLDIASITIAGDFAFTSVCPATLAAGATCDIVVTFTPLSIGTRAGTLTLATNAPGSPHVLALSGSGRPVPVPGILLTPSGMDFVAQTVGTESALQLVTVSNDGTAPLVFGAITASGDFAATLVLVSPNGPCVAPLAPGASCEIGVSFRPTASGLRTGTLSIDSNAPTATTTMRLAGTALDAVPARALTVPASLVFAIQRVGTQSAGLALDLVNNLATRTTITELSATGDFNISDTCTSIAARGRCTPLVSFRPTAVGERSGAVTIRTLSEALPYTVRLAGTGVFNPLPSLSLAVTHAGFGNTFMGSSSTVSVAVTNSGQVPVVFGSFPVTGDYFVTNGCGATLDAGVTCTVQITFLPTTLGSRTGSLEIRSNAEGSPHRIELSGVGCRLPGAIRARLGAPLCGS